MYIYELVITDSSSTLLFFMEERRDYGLNVFGRVMSSVPLSLIRYYIAMYRVQNNVCAYSISHNCEPFPEKVTLYRFTSFKCEHEAERYHSLS